MTLKGVYPHNDVHGFFFEHADNCPLQIGAAPGSGVNPKVMVMDIPATKFDDVGRIEMLAAGGGFVLVRRPGCYPMIRTIKEWRALSDTAVVYAASVHRGAGLHGRGEVGG
jgi:hypothetical protein